VLEGSASMYHIPDLGRFLKCILPELARRAAETKCPLPLELGISTDDERWLIHIQGKHSRVEPDKLSRRHLSLKAPALVRLLLGHSGVDACTEDESFVASTATALEAARVLFPAEPIWRSPLDGGTA
jgi:hypothetical protein